MPVSRFTGENVKVDTRAQRSALQLLRLLYNFFGLLASRKEGETAKMGVLASPALLPAGLDLSTRCFQNRMRELARPMQLVWQLRSIGIAAVTRCSRHLCQCE